MMYVPPAFAEPNRSKLLEFITAHSFGLLVSHVGGELYASHLPLLVRGEESGPQLVGHMARANPQWRDLDGQRVLAVFTGPHSYISPRWYENDNVVPTWNYQAVQVQGTCEIVDDEQMTGEIVQDYVSTYEQVSPDGAWAIDSGSPFFRKLIEMVVGFRVRVEHIEGKWKLSQNRPARQRANVARHLAASHDPAAREIGRLMAESLESDD